MRLTLVLAILPWASCSSDQQRARDAAQAPRNPGTIADAPPLAYRFEVGEELVYDTNDVLRAFLFSFEHSEVEAVCPLARRADGSWRLLFRWTFTMDDEVTRAVCRIDLMPDGRVADCNPPGCAPRIGPWRPLPVSLDGASHEGDIWSLPTESGVWAFDVRRGRSIRVESETQEDWQTHKRTTTLREAVPRDAEWVSRAGRESEDVITTLWRDGFRYRGARTERVEAAYAATRARFDALLLRTTLPELRGPVEDAIAKADSMAVAFRKKSERLRSSLDVPSPEWTLRDLEGKEHRVTDYRGSAVVLEFWESG